MSPVSPAQLRTRIGDETIRTDDDRGDGGDVLIEWGEAILPDLPHDLLEVRVTFGPEDDDRFLAFSAVGPAWAPRTDALAGVISPWGTTG